MAKSRTESGATGIQKHETEAAIGSSNEVCKRYATNENAYLAKFVNADGEVTLHVIEAAETETAINRAKEIVEDIQELERKHMERNNPVAELRRVYSRWQRRHERSKLYGQVVY